MKILQEDLFKVTLVGGRSLRVQENQLWDGVQGGSMQYGFEKLTRPL